MRFIFSLSLIALSLATTNRLRGMALFRRDSTCSDMQAVCDDYCIYLTDYCCYHGDGSFCPPGHLCVPDGCCPVGDQACFLGSSSLTTHTGSFNSPTSKAGGVLTTGQTPSMTAPPVTIKTTTATERTSTIVQKGGVAGRQSLSSEIYAVAIVAVGQVLLM